jgi:hypothetical protein
VVGGSRAAEGRRTGRGGPQDRSPVRRRGRGRRPDPDPGVEAVADDLVGVVVEAVRPARPNVHGSSWESVLAHEEQIRAWVGGGSADPLSIVKIGELLARVGLSNGVCKRSCR